MNSLSKLRRVFSERIKFFREARGWTQHDLAATADMKTPTLRGYEQGIRWPDPEDIEAIAKALSVPAYKLFGTEFIASPAEALEVLREAILKVGNPGFGVGQSALAPEKSKDIQQPIPVNRLAALEKKTKQKDNRDNSPKHPLSPSAPISEQPAESLIKSAIFKRILKLEPHKLSLLKEALDGLETGDKELQVERGDKENPAQKPKNKGNKS